MLKNEELFYIYKNGVCNIAPYWLRIKAKVAFINIVELAPIEAVPYIKFVKLIKLIKLIKLDRILRVYLFY